MTQIDAIDERILTELQANGRLTMKALAERVGLSSPAMIERVRRLEEHGIIAGYRAVISPATLGRPMTAVITAEVSAENTPAFLKTVGREPGVVECHRLTGVFNYLVKVHVADAAELASLLDLFSETGAVARRRLCLHRRSNGDRWPPLETSRRRVGGCAAGAAIAPVPQTA